MESAEGSADCHCVAELPGDRKFHEVPHQCTSLRDRPAPNPVDSQVEPSFPPRSTPCLGVSCIPQCNRHRNRARCENKTLRLSKLSPNCQQPKRDRCGSNPEVTSCVQ